MDNLNVQIFSQPNNQKWFDKVKNYLTIPKIIFFILGIIILVEIIITIRSMIAPVSAPPVSKINNQGMVEAIAPRISLNVSKTSFRSGEGVPVSVFINTGGKSLSGADLIIRFDPKFMEATQGAVLKGAIFDEYPLASVDTKKGLVSISGIDNLQNSFKGVGQFALINFKTKLPGKTSVTIEFIKGATTASNLVEAATSKNILEQVDNLELEIQ